MWMWIAMCATVAAMDARDSVVSLWQAESIGKRGWWLAHNCIAHPWMGIMPNSTRAVEFHRMTADRMGDDSGD